MKKEIKKRKRNLVDEAEDILKKAKDREFSDINVQWVANKLNVSYKYISRQFPLYRFYNLKDFIRGERITRADKLLKRYPRMRLKTLIDILGFSSVSFFIKTYQEYNALSPALAQWTYYFLKPDPTVHEKYRHLYLSTPDDPGNLNGENSPG